VDTNLLFGVKIGWSLTISTFGNNCVYNKNNSFQLSFTFMAAVNLSNIMKIAEFHKKIG
jgi:hypothetical protein